MWSHQIRIPKATKGREQKDGHSAVITQKNPAHLPAYGLRTNTLFGPSCVISALSMALSNVNGLCKFQQRGCPGGRGDRAGVEKAHFFVLS